MILYILFPTKHEHSQMISDYIEYITLKRKELGGHAICPFAKKFLDKTEIIESEDMEEDAIKCLESE